MRSRKASENLVFTAGGTPARKKREGRCESQRPFLFIKITLEIFCKKNTGEKTLSNKITIFAAKYLQTLMKRLLLLTACTVLMGACVSDEYDLGNIDTEGIGIGDAASEFVLPLANIHVGSDELLAGEGDITGMFSNIEAWIPGSYASIEVQRLGDSRYVDQWIADLCKGMDVDNEFARVVEHIHKTRREDFRQCGVTPTDDLAAYKAQFKGLWSNSRTRGRIENKIGEVVASEIAAIDAEVAPVEYEIQNDGLDEEVIDMLIDEQNDDALELFGSVLNKMEPIECTLKAEFLDTSVGFDVSLPAAVTAAAGQADPADDTVNADNAVAVPNVKIPAKDARQIIEQGLMRVTVTPVKFYPRTAYPEGEQMLVHLKLRRKGGLKVNF